MVFTEADLRGGKKVIKNWSVIVFLLLVLPVSGQHLYKNPVIPGFHPDPSICRVGEDYYLVNSSFEWFPGIPIYHSKDLVNWQQIGHVLTRKSQLNMVTTRPSAGIWAPTIRYHEGWYYVVVTCKQCENECDCGFNFFVRAKDPTGPWSDPVWVKGTTGIDPTIFWDDDGKVYYVGSSKEIGGPPRWQAEGKIYIQEMDIETGILFGDPVILTSGHASDARHVEGPHIYKRNGKYLLIAAEGGTWNMHAVTGFVSDSLFGPYAPLQSNPIITHRHLGRRSPVTTLGHADIVETQKGEWWMVLLGVRPIDGYYYLGRETFLVPFEFEGMTPVVNFPSGQVLMEGPAPSLPWTPFEAKAPRDEFENAELGYQWNFLRTPQENWWEIDAKKGLLKLKLRPETVKDYANPSLVARRFEHHHFTAMTKMIFNPKNDSERAGLVAMQNDKFHYRVELGIEGKEQYLYLYKCGGNDRKVLKEQLVHRVIFEGKEVVLGMKVDMLDIQFYYGKDENNMIPLGPVQDARNLSSSVSGGFIGAFVGMYAASNGQTSKNVATFEWFEYRPGNQ